MIADNIHNKKVPDILKIKRDWLMRIPFPAIKLRDFPNLNRNGKGVD
jgi:hypothetical protein